MKKKARKLTLSRDVLRTAAPSDLASVAGGISQGCSSENCTVMCPNTGPQTYCVCPTSESQPIRSCMTTTVP